MSQQVFRLGGFSKLLIFLVVVALLALSSASWLFEYNTVGHYVVIQHPVTGGLTLHTTPGLKWQGFGSVAMYNIEDILYFSKHPDESGRWAGDQSIPVRFNDGATASITVNIRFRIPSSQEKFMEMHSRFRDYEALKKDGMEQLVTETVILTASLMSAEESYTTKRAMFSELAWDQLDNGIYLTEEVITETIDEITGEKTYRKVVRVKINSDGRPLRKQNFVDDFEIKVSQFVCKDIDYEEKVDEQIQKKREALMQTVAAKAQADKAIQDRLTAEEEGKKNVAVAKYEGEVIKQRAVVQAEQEKSVAETEANKKLAVEKLAKEQALVAANRQLEVAKLEAQAAEQKKTALIALGSGEAEAARLRLEADGALKLKLDVWQAVMNRFAEAMERAQQPLVPQFVMGGSTVGGQPTSMGTTQDFIALLGMKAAHDLALDLTAAKPTSKSDRTVSGN